MQSIQRLFFVEAHFNNPCVSLASFSIEDNYLLNFKEDLQVALSQGGRLLECINEPLQTDPEYRMTYDELENLATVQR